MCGVGPLVDRPLLYMPLLLTMNMSNGWCVKKCPTSSGCICRDELNVHDCPPGGLGENCYLAYESSEAYICLLSFYLIPLRHNFPSAFGRCIPAALSSVDASKLMGEYTNLAVRGIRDLYATWHVFLISAGACIVLCIIWMLILRFCAGCMVWTGLFLVLTVVGGVAAYLLYYGLSLTPRDARPIIPQASVNTMTPSPWAVRRSPRLSSSSSVASWRLATSSSCSSSLPCVGPPPPASHSLFLPFLSSLPCQACLRVLPVFAVHHFTPPSATPLLSVSVLTLLLLSPFPHSLSPPPLRNR